MTCDATGQTSAQVVASSELPLVPMLFAGQENWQERLASTCVLCSNDSQALASWKKLAVKFEQAQISRKLTQATASWRSNEAQASTSKNLRWLAFSFDQGLTIKDFRDNFCKLKRGASFRDGLLLEINTMGFFSRFSVVYDYVFTNYEYGLV